MQPFIIAVASSRFEIICSEIRTYVYLDFSAGAPFWTKRGVSLWDGASLLRRMNMRPARVGNEIKGELSFL